MLAATFSLSKHTCLEKKGLRLFAAQPPKSRRGIKRGRGRAGSCSLLEPACSRHWQPAPAVSRPLPGPFLSSWVQIHDLKKSSCYDFYYPEQQQQSKN